MSFLEALHDRVLVCDGAMGSVLYDRGVFVNQSFEALNLTRPELVVAVHQRYVDAGADVIETNTFGANQMRLAAFGLGDQFAQINIAGVRLARQAAGAAGYVAGAIGPLGVTVGDGGATTVETAEWHFAEQAAALIEGGVDLLLLETFRTVPELEAAVRAVRGLTALPVVAQMATGEDGLSPDGVPPEQIAATLLARGATVVGVNCGMGPAATLDDMWARHEYTTISSTALSNHLAALALSPEVRPQILERTRGFIRRGFPVLKEWAENQDGKIRVFPCDAAAIAFARYDLDVNSTELVERLRDELNVLIVPGDHFGIDHCLRISFGLQHDYLKGGLERISAGLLA